jgi:hypothetical protein
MILASSRQVIEADLHALKARHGLAGEVKWTKVRRRNWERVAALVDRFLDFVEYGSVKLRYMWIDQLKQNPGALNDNHREFGYFILYYFFVVFSFGLPWNDDPEGASVELLVDTLPDDPTKRASFQSFLLGCHRARRFENQAPFRIMRVALGRASLN